MKTTRWLQPLAACVMALAVTGLVTLFFTVKVCDGQLTSTGTVVQVCRHPQATDPPIAALGLLVLALMGFFFSEISGFGFTLKRSVDAAKRTAQEAASEARATNQQIGELAEDLTEGVKTALDQTRPPVTDETDPVKRLAARYNEIRWTMPSGYARTAEMTSVVQEMIDLFEGGYPLDRAAAITSGDRGIRLAALADLYARPDPAWADQVARVAVAESKPFNEYWALRTLDRLIDEGATLAAESVQLLNQRLAQLPPGVDRAVQLRTLLAKVLRRNASRSSATS